MPCSVMPKNINKKANLRSYGYWHLKQEFSNFALRLVWQWVHVGFLSLFSRLANSPTCLVKGSQVLSVRLLNVNGYQKHNDFLIFHVSKTLRFPANSADVDRAYWIGGQFENDVIDWMWSTAYYLNLPSVSKSVKQIFSSSSQFQLFLWVRK